LNTLESLKQIKMWKTLILISLSMVHGGYARGLASRCFTPTLENGWVEAEENMAANTFVGRFRCQPGFVLSGATTVKCRQGRWSVRPDNFPLCAAIGSCDPASLPAIKNGFKKANPRYSNSVYRYSCKKGYRLVGTSTVFCSQAGWSVAEAPVCTRAGCELENLMGEEGVRNGRARALWGGAAFRFSCNAGSEMDGNSMVFCDGKYWNGTKPECLVPPSPPTFSLTVGGVKMENPSLGVGEEVTINCENEGGNPAPSLALYVGEEQVVSSMPGGPAQYTFTVQAEHDTVQVYCTADNSMVHHAVHSQVQVIRLKYPASNTYIRGSRLVMSEEYTQYACSSDEADPAPRMEVSVTDQNGDTIEVNIEKMPKMKGRKGFAARVVFGINFEEHIKTAEIECKAVNEAGEATSNITTRVQYAPKTIEISGVTAVKHDEKEAVYTCSSSASYPEPSIVWNKLVNGKLVKIDEKDTDVDTKYTKSGVLKTSKYSLHPERTQDENVLLYCIVKIQELKFEKSSEVLDILITYPPKKIFIGGPDSVTPGEQAEFKCTVEGGHPAPSPILVVTDQYQNPLLMTPTYNTSVSVVVKNHHQVIYASCFAGNEAGFLQNTKEIAVNYAPHDVAVSGPHHVHHGEEAKYECISAFSSPTAKIDWKVWSASGEAVEFVTDDTAEDDKQTVSRLTLLASKTQQDITVQCMASNIAGYADNSISTVVTYPATHLILSGPASLSPSASATYYCSTDDSVPAATLDWSVTTGEKEDSETLEIGEGDVETYETALTSGGVQTHSVLTLPGQLTSPQVNLKIRCSAREDPEELYDQIDVTWEESEEVVAKTNDDDETIDETIQDPAVEKMGTNNEEKIVAEIISGIPENSIGGNDENQDNGNDKAMVKLEAIENDDVYDVGYKKDSNKLEMSNENVYSRVEDYDTNEDGADEPTFHQSEVESVNIPLKLGDRPRQQVEMSLYSSAAKLDLKLCLLLLPAIFFFRS